MSTPSSSIIGRKVWIGVRFVLFGFVGFGVMIYSTGSLMLTVLDRQQEIFSPYLSAPLAVVGSLMIVYGVGEWVSGSGGPISGFFFPSRFRCS